MSPKESLKSTIEVSAIYLEAGALVVHDTVEFVKSIPSRVDTWLSDYGDSDV